MNNKRNLIQTQGKLVKFIYFTDEPQADKLEIKLEIIIPISVSDREEERIRLNDWKPNKLSQFTTYFLECQRVLKRDTLLERSEKLSFPLLSVSKTHPNLQISLKDSLHSYLTPHPKYQNVFYFEATLVSKEPLVRTTIDELIKLSNEDITTMDKDDSDSKDGYESGVYLHKLLRSLTNWVK